MTQTEKNAKADQSLKLVKKSAQSLEDGMKDKDDYIRVLELTIGRLVWLCEQPVEQEVKTEQI